MSLAAHARQAVRALSNPPRAPWPRRHGWIASDTDVILAQHAAFELQTQRCKITLVPADPADPRNAYGRKLRVCESTTPRWYQELFYRRTQAQRPSIRAYVCEALAHLCATRYIRPTPWAMDVEVLDVLYAFFDARDFGYPDWAGGLRLRPNGYAERYRRHRRAREGRR